MEMQTCLTVEKIPIWNIYDSYAAADLRCQFQCQLYNLRFVSIYFV